MIDFRYHLVSIVAVFLALAIGIVLGTTALNGPVLDNLKQNVNGLSQDKRGLEAQVRKAQSQLSDEQGFEQAVAPLAVADQLPGLRVALISAPGANPNVRTALATMLAQAGASVTVQVALADQFLDPSQDDKLGQLLSQLDPGGTALADGTAVQRAASTLAAALVRPVGVVTAASELTRPMLEGFARAGYLSMDGPTSAAGTVALLLVGPAPDPPTATDAVAADRLLTLTQALDQHGAGALVAGSNGGGRGVVGALLADGQLAATVSSVDDADTTAGQVQTVFALAALLRGDVGHLGRADGASPGLLLPSSTPTPSASTSSR